MPRSISPTLSDDPSPRGEELGLHDDLTALIAVGLVEERREPQGVVYALTDLGRHTGEFGT